MVFLSSENIHLPGSGIGAIELGTIPETWTIAAIAVPQLGT